MVGNLCCQVKRVHDWQTSNMIVCVRRPLSIYWLGYIACPCAPVKQRSLQIIDSVVKLPSNSIEPFFSQLRYEINA